MREQKVYKGEKALTLYISKYYMYYKKMKYVKKTITIPEEQAKWIKDNSINLSRFVQKKIDKEMKK